ncbi:MAG TPA: bifunctional nuclease family protein [Firmicutes bacterium]|nr:bifunctional nuclease family protein [Candidatus Fermentithermobacillaceae bacterium]
MVQVTVDKVGLDQDGEQAVVLLADLTKSTLIPIWIRAMEATAIALPLQGLKAPRPLTSDLVISVIEHLGAEVVMAIIREIKDGTFYASLVLTRGDEEIEIDCRPSDAIAVALRRASPIYVMERVLAEAGIRSEEDTVQ